VQVNSKDLALVAEGLRPLAEDEFSGAFDLGQLATMHGLRRLIATDHDLDVGDPAVLLDVLRAIDRYAHQHAEPAQGRRRSRTDVVQVIGLLIGIDDHEDMTIGARYQRVLDKFGIQSRQLQKDRRGPEFRLTYIRYIQEKLVDPSASSWITAQAQAFQAHRIATADTAAASAKDSAALDDHRTLVTPGTVPQIDWERWKQFPSRTVSADLVGVDSVIPRLAGYLASLDPGPTVVSGAGGLGKTSVMVKALNTPTVRERYRGAIWVNSINVGVGESADSQYHWPQILTSLAAQLSVETGPATTRTERDIQQRLNQLPADARVLCVVDNLEGLHDGEQIVERLEKIGLAAPHGVALTSRPVGDRFAVGGKHLAMLPLDQDHTAELVFQENPGLRVGGDAIADEIFRISQGNPYLILLVATQYFADKLPIEYIIEELKRSEATYAYLFKRSIEILSRTATPHLAAALMQGFCRRYRGSLIAYDELFDLTRIPDRNAFNNVLRVASRLNLVQATDIGRHYSIHSLLYTFLKQPDINV
jgi:NB-ARC domain